MPDLFRIFVTVSLVNLASRGLSTLASDLLKVDMRTKSAQAAMSKLRASLLVGGGMVAGGMALASALGKAVDLAADVELSITRLQSLTQGSAQQMAEFTRQTQLAAHATAIFSQKEAAELGVTIEQSTKMSIDSINKTLPAFAMFAEAQQKLHGTSATAAVTAAGQMSKTLGLSPEELPQFLENLHRISAAMPKTAQLPSLARDVNRPLAFLRGLGADRMQEDELIRLQAQLTSMGGGGATFGGRNLLMALTRVMAPTAGGAAVEDKLGITGRDRKGRLDLFTLEEQLATVRARHPEVQQPEFIGMMKALFGQNALALAMRLTAPDIGKRTTEFKAAEARVDPIQTFVNKFLNTFAGAKTQLITDFASAMAEFGKHLLPVMVPLLHFFDRIVVAATNFMQANPALTKIIALITALGAAGLVAGGITVMLAGLVSFITAIAPALPAVGQGLAVAAAGMAAVLAAGTALAIFFKKHPKDWEKLKNDLAVIMGQLKEIFIELKPVIREAIAVLKPLVTYWLEGFVQKLHFMLKAVQMFVSGVKFELGGGVSGWLKDHLMGPQKKVGMEQAHKNVAWWGVTRGPGGMGNQVGSNITINVHGAGDPRAVAREVASELAKATRQASKGSGTNEELAYATNFMYV